MGLGMKIFIDGMISISPVPWDQNLKHRWRWSGPVNIAIIHRGDSQIEDTGPNGNAEWGQFDQGKKSARALSLEKKREEKGESPLMDGVRVGI